MISFINLSPENVAIELAVRLRNRRLQQNLTQQGLARRSGVPLGTLKKFERSGQIALTSFVRLAITLRDEAALGELLVEQKFETLDEILHSGKKPQRGRIN